MKTSIGSFDKSYDSNLISFQCFMDALDNDDFQDIYRRLMKWVKTYKKAMVKSEAFRSFRKDSSFRKFKKDIRGWAAAAQTITPTGDAYDCFYLMKKQDRVGLYTILEFICSDTTNSYEVNEDMDPMFIFATAFSSSAFAEYYILKGVSSGNFSSDFSGGGGCGGCCEGGGAD